jgi:hypothetical protein
MRGTLHRITTLAALTVVAAGAAATTAGADPHAIDRPAECVAWEAAMSRSLALYGITGAQADSYIAQRLDNPCHARITPRSSFHAGDPGKA